MNAYNQVMRVYCKEDGQYYDMVLEPDFWCEVRIIKTVPFLKWWTRRTSKVIDSYSSSEVFCGRISPEELMEKFEKSINTYVRRKRLEQELKEEADIIWSQWKESNETT